ncbi:MAG: hypothetical protein IT430_09895 [Phycisphaerales bacterium]|nr:hypothetical protein [Phycisphaerales bacterium]
MAPTQTQLRTVNKFTFGSATHRVLGSTMTSRLERRGANHDAFRVYTFSIRSEIEGASKADLKTQLDTLRSECIASAQNFRLYREDQITYELLTADCHHGPVATIQADGREQHGLIESFTLNVEASVPVSVDGEGLIAHHYTERIREDEDGTAETVRTGQVTTAAGDSAADWISANVPAQPAGYLRTLEISADDTDTEATYTLTDARSDRRNVSATVRNHIYTHATVKIDGDLTQEVWSGSVTMAPANSARAFIEANLPAQGEKTSRTVQIANADDDLTGTYTVTDVPAEWSTLPGIEEGSQSNQVETDEHNRLRYVRSGYFIGATAQQQIDQVRETLAALGRIVSQTLTYDLYGDQRITFQFTALAASDGTGIISWEESVSRRGGRKRRVADLSPDQEPYFFFDLTQPIVVEIVGRAVALRNADGTDRYVKPPLPPILEGGIFYADWQDGDTEYELARVDAHHCQTTWRQTFFVPVGTPIPVPRGPLPDFF